ncbi:hypothetical protein KX816_03805 [Sphingosinicellaceae bacterium]|nr:hypothetical protein KX816_03805 [Sphingosinicellaceae bacterium]
MLYYVTVPNKGGGTRRDGGFNCRFCGQQNLVAPNELPVGVLTTLPSQADRLLATETSAANPVSAPVPAPVPAAPVKSAVKAKPQANTVKPPAWVTGAEARQLLLGAYQRTKELTAFTRRADGTLQAGTLVPPKAGTDLIAWLDQIACELLVLGGVNGDGSRWKAVFHPSAGAATLAREPGGPEGDGAS